MCRNSFDYCRIAKTESQSEVVAMFLMSTMITEWCPLWMVCPLCMRSASTRSVRMHFWSRRNCSRQICTDASSLNRPLEIQCYTYLSSANEVRPSVRPSELFTWYLKNRFTNRLVYRFKIWYQTTESTDAIDFWSSDKYKMAAIELLKIYAMDIPCGLNISRINSPIYFKFDL